MIDEVKGKYYGSLRLMTDGALEVSFLDFWRLTAFVIDWLGREVYYPSL